MAVIGGLFLLVGLLGWGHWCALWWEPVALRPDVARPLRLDQTDSFGTWFGAVMLAVTGGASLLIYQLRRYRSDDYHGHYRLWRWVLLIVVAGSIDSVAGLADWGGALIDVLFGAREILAGADWVRLLLGFCGLALGIRVVAEVFRNRAASATMIASLILFGVPLGVRWNVIELSPATSAVVIPLAILTARAMLLTSTILYLRMLYREVRGIREQNLFWERLRGVWLRTTRRVETEETDSVPVRKRKTRSSATPAVETIKAGPASQPQASSVAAAVLSANTAASASAVPPAAPAAATAPAAPAAASASDDGATAPKTRFWGWFRGTLKRTKAAESVENTAPAAPVAAAGPVAKKNETSVRPLPSTAKPLAGSPVDAIPDEDPRDSGDQDDGDGEGTGGEAMSRSERRRLRKLMKRQGRAA